MNFNPTFVNQIASLATQTPIGGQTPYMLARVTHVVTGPYLEGTNIPDTNYKDTGDLGKITYQLMDNLQARTLDSGGNPPARPVYSSLKQYPVEGEFVLLVQGPSIALNENRDNRDFYYLPPFNLWNASNHNALPDLGDYSDWANTDTRGYGASLETNQPVNLSSTASINYPLGPNFPEKDNIKTLRQFAGDVTIEGRWGNSIRFGSTSQNSRFDNYWSEVGDAGSPITIIRNGQGTQLNNEGWIPTVENINRDPSSIYLTNGQKIVIDDIQNNFSLLSFQVNLENTQTVSIPLQQQLTSIDSLSAAEQDARIANAASQTLNP
jgi:hypothetical protein